MDDAGYLRRVSGRSDGLLDGPRSSGRSGEELFQTTLLLLLVLITPLGSWARSTAAWELVSFGVALSSTEKPHAPELDSLDSGAKSEANAEQLEQEVAPGGPELPASLGATHFEVPLFEFEVARSSWSVSSPGLLSFGERLGPSSRGPPVV